MAALHDHRRTTTRGKLRAPAQRVPSDPRFPADGVCVRVECENVIPPLAALNEDPFCSTVCCRAWYDVTIDSLVPRGRRQL